MQLQKKLGSGKTGKPKVQALTEECFVQQTQDSATFTVKQGRATFTSSIGPRHQCSCKHRQPCIHIVKILTSHFGLSPSDSLVKQTGVRELELEALLEKNVNTYGCCAICREELVAETGCTVCGEKYHSRCLDLRTKALQLRENCCPKCNSVQSSKNDSVQVLCSGCRRPCRMQYYICALCPEIHVCSECYDHRHVHDSHPLTRQKCCGQNRKQPVVLDASELASRDIRPDDYEALLLLDDTVAAKVLCASEFKRLPTELFQTRNSACNMCMICHSQFASGDSLVRLPCGHTFHVGCGKRWLTEYKAECPIDHTAVKDSFPRGQ